MKNKNIIIIAIALLIFFGLIGYSIYLSTKFENSKFKSIDLSKSKNVVTNYSSIPYLDTLSHVMMDGLGLECVEIALHDVSDNVRSSIFKGEIVNGFVVERFDGVLQVFIYPFKTRTKTFQILAHELIHVSQFVNGELQVIDSSTAVWKGDTLDLNDVKYADRAWEKAAFNGQIKLFNYAKNILIE